MRYEGGSRRILLIRRSWKVELGWVTPREGPTHSGGGEASNWLIKKTATIATKDM